MAKITQEQRNRYAAKVKEYKATIDALLAKEQSMLTLVNKGPERSNGYARFKLIQDLLPLTSYHILMNTLSVSMLGVKNEDALAEARKTLARAFKYLEDIVTPYVDAPFSEYEKNLELIADIGYEDRYTLVRKIAFAISEIEEGYGANSKWKWSFVDLWAKLAVVGKNMLDLKKAYTDLDLTSPNRMIVTSYLSTIKNMFRNTADKYREKYETFSSKMDDFKQAITFLQALRRLHTVFGERDDAEELKKKIDIWSNKLETDKKRQDEEKKRQA
ncbi:MAG: hypothetical protein KKI09_13050 [Spirochaetes bacterium]|nr:hypothetical protein [Spirochaetota bacterium]MBU0956350.1 hypothetical protein [Spirochaetota bacterium]